MCVVFQQDGLRALNNGTDTFDDLQLGVMMKEFREFNVPKPAESQKERNRRELWPEEWR